MLLYIPYGTDTPIYRFPGMTTDTTEQNKKSSEGDGFYIPKLENKGIPYNQRNIGKLSKFSNAARPTVQRKESIMNIKYKN